MSDPGEVLERMLNIWDKSLRAAVPNPEMFFFFRAELGLLNTLNRLGAKIAPSDVARRIRSGPTPRTGVTAPEGPSSSSP
jgi:hypothetical protein